MKDELLDKYYYRQSLMIDSRNSFIKNLLISFASTSITGAAVVGDFYVAISLFKDLTQHVEITESQLHNFSSYFTSSAIAILTWLVGFLIILQLAEFTYESWGEATSSYSIYQKNKEEVKQLKKQLTMK